MELRYTEQVFSEEDACSTGKLIFLRDVEIYMQVRVVISRVDLYQYSRCTNILRSLLPLSFWYSTPPTGRIEQQVEIIMDLFWVDLMLYLGERNSSIIN